MTSFLDCHLLSGNYKQKGRSQPCHAMLNDCLLTKKRQHNSHVEFAEKNVVDFWFFFHWKKSFLYASGTTRNLLFSHLCWDDTLSNTLHAGLIRAVSRQGCRLESVEFSLSSDTGYPSQLAALRSNMLSYSFHSGFGCRRQLVRKCILSLMSV